MVFLSDTVVTPTAVLKLRLCSCEKAVSYTHLEQQRRKAIEDEKQYLKAKGIFFGLAFTDSLICVKVIELSLIHISTSMAIVRSKMTVRKKVISSTVTSDLGFFNNALNVRQPLML